MLAKNSPRSLESLAEAVERILAANQPMAVLIDPVADKAAELIAEATSTSFAVIHCRSVDEALAKLDASKGAIEIVIVRHAAISEVDHALLETLALRFGDDSVRVVGFATEAVDGAAARFNGRKGTAHRGRSACS